MNVSFSLSLSLSFYIYIYIYCLHFPTNILRKDTFKIPNLFLVLKQPFWSVEIFSKTNRNNSFSKTRHWNVLVIFQRWGYEVVVCNVRLLFIPYRPALAEDTFSRLVQNLDENVHYLIAAKRRRSIHYQRGSWSNAESPFSAWKTLSLDMRRSLLPVRSSGKCYTFLKFILSIYLLFLHSQVK